MPIDSTHAMRDFMSLINAYTAQAPEVKPGGEPAAPCHIEQVNSEQAMVESAMVESAQDIAGSSTGTQAARLVESLLAESRDLIFKLPAHSETDMNEERALGIEQGFSRAADMIENLLRRYGKG